VLLADRAVALLAHRVQGRGLGGGEATIRAAMQMAEAAALDALTHERGALRAGSNKMAKALTAMMLAMIGGRRAAAEWKPVRAMLTMKG
jgi:hypothetical protein